MTGVEAQQGPKPDVTLRLAESVAMLASDITDISSLARALRMAQPGNQQVAGLQSAIVKLLETMIAHNSAVDAALEENRLRRATCQPPSQ